MAIDEKKLVEELEKLKQEVHLPVDIVWNTLLKVCIDTVNEQPKVDVPDINVGKWIPCSEGVPQEDKTSEYYESVIVTLDDGRVAGGCYTGVEWWVDAPDGEHYSEDMTGHVIAWQPLPEPYKGE